MFNTLCPKLVPLALTGEKLDSDFVALTLGNRGVKNSYACRIICDEECIRQWMRISEAQSDAARVSGKHNNKVRRRSVTTEQQRILGKMPSRRNGMKCRVICHTRE